MISLFANGHVFGNVLQRRLDRDTRLNVWTSLAKNPAERRRDKNTKNRTTTVFTFPRVEKIACDFVHFRACKSHVRNEKPPTFLWARVHNHNRNRRSRAHIRIRNVLSVGRVTPRLCERRFPHVFPRDGSSVVVSLGAFSRATRASATSNRENVSSAKTHT